jgi:TPR repeat protein
MKFETPRSLIFFKIFINKKNTKTSQLKSIKKKFKMNLSKIKSLVEEGDLDAQHQLAEYYLNDDNADYNPELAIKLFEEASESGHKKSQLQLVDCYLHGKGVEKNKEKAFKLVESFIKKNHCSNRQSKPNDSDQFYDETSETFKESIRYYQNKVKEDDTKSQVELASLYSDGIGIKQDKNKAFELYKKAAIKNNAEAQFSLGMCYEFGNGVEVNKQKAIEWYEKSAKQGNVKAKSRIEICKDPQKELEEIFNFIPKMVDFDVIGENFFY